MLQRKDVDVCAKCLAQDISTAGKLSQYLRARWAISSYRICSVHGIELRRLARAEYPRCIFDFYQRINDQRTLIDSWTINEHKLHETSFSSYIARRLSGRRNRSWLDELDLDVACRFCEVLGLLVRFGAKAQVSSCNNLDMALAAETGFKIATKGPDEISRAMSGVRSSAPSARNGFYVDFEVVYNFFSRLDRNEKRNAPLLDWAANFAFTNYSFSRGDILFGRTCPKRYNYCPASLADRYGLARTTARKMMRSIGGCTHADGSPIMKAETIIPHMERFASSVLPSVAAAKLGIPVEMLMRLVKARLIAPCPDITGTIMRFDPQAIVNFKQRIFSDSVETACLGKDWVPLKRVGQVFGYSLDHVCALILNGELSQLRHYPNALSLYDLHLNKQDVLGRMADAATIGYSKTDLKQILGINDPTVAHIVRKRMIVGFEVKTPLNHKKMVRFVPRAIDSFLREYLPLGLFARNAGMQPRAAMLYFATLDLQALDWPRKYSRIYRRTKLSEEILDRPIVWSPT